MKKNFLTPYLITGFLSVLIGIFVIIKIPSEIEKPVLIFGQSSSEIDPELVPLIVAIMLIIFGSYTMIKDRNALLNNSWPNLTQTMLKNVGFAILCLTLYSILFNSLGFVLSSALLIFILSKYMGEATESVKQEGKIKFGNGEGASLDTVKKAPEETQQQFHSVSTKGDS